MASFCSGYFLFGGWFHWFNFNKFLDTDPSSDVIKASQKIQILYFTPELTQHKGVFFKLTSAIILLSVYEGLTHESDSGGPRNPIHSSTSWSKYLNSWVGMHCLYLRYLLRCASPECGKLYSAICLWFYIIFLCTDVKQSIIFYTKYRWH